MRLDGRLPIEILSRLVRKGTLKPSALLDAALARIEATDRELNAIVHLAPDLNRAAAEADREIASGLWRGPLHGMLVVHKCNVSVAAMPLTSNCRARADAIASRDASVVRRLREAGVLCIGLANMHELAFGLPAEDNLYPPPRNPWDLFRSPGGSSSGSAVAVAAGFAQVATGTDTSGSIRHPAAVCGVVGLKPTHRALPRAGIAALAPELEDAGPLALTVRGARIAFQSMAGQPVQLPEGNAGEHLRDKAIAVPQAPPRAGCSEEVLACFDAALAVLSRLGARVRHVHIEHLDEAPAWATALLAHGAWSRFGAGMRRSPALYGANTRARLEQYAMVGERDVLVARRGRARLVRAFGRLFESGVHAIATPGREAAADLVGAAPSAPRGRAHQPFNLCGLPAVVLPCGFTPQGLPVSLQFAGRWNDEDSLLRTAACYEDATRWWEREPAFLARMHQGSGR
jgi:aspartyl-tRNA(Asn)/glutamyl-tRNA(Gln) amidotransferase subunit A